MRKLLVVLSIVQFCAVLTCGNKVNPTSIDVTIKKVSPNLALAKKTTAIAQQADVLRQISKQLKKHAAIAPLKSSLSLQTLSKKVKRIADKKDQAAVTIIKKTLPQSMTGLRQLNKNTNQSIKTIIKRMIQKVGNNIPSVSVNKLNKEVKVNHKRSVKIGKQTVKVLKTMEKKGIAISPKRAKALVNQTLSNKKVYPLKRMSPNISIINKKEKQKLNKLSKPLSKKETKKEKIKALRKMIKIVEKSLLRLMNIPQTVKS